MKKQYTKKQIQEAISYWKKQLTKLNESNYGSSKTGALYKLSKLFKGPYMFNGDIDNGFKQANVQVTFDRFPSLREIHDKFDQECMKKFGQKLYDKDNFGVVIHFGGVYDGDGAARIYVADSKDDADTQMEFMDNDNLPICLVWPNPT